MGSRKYKLQRIKSNEIINAREAAITAAINALENLPTLEEMTKENVSEVKQQANLAKKLVEEALNLGAVEADLTGLDHLDAVFVKLSELGLSLEEALQIANTSLQAVLQIGEVNEGNAAEVYKIYLKAYLDIANAKAVGAEDADFNQEAFAKYNTLPDLLEPFAPTRPNYGDPLKTLEYINSNLNTFDARMLHSVVDVYVDEALFEAYRNELIKQRNAGIQEFTLADIKNVVEYVNSLS